MNAHANIGSFAAANTTMPTTPSGAPASVFGGTAVEVARRLATALDAELGGRFVAHVFPASAGQYPIEFVDEDMPLEQPSINDLIASHEAALQALNIAASASDTVALGRPATDVEEQRCDDASDAEVDALMATCDFRAVTKRDAISKAAYLLADRQQDLMDGMAQFTFALLQSLVPDDRESRFDIARPA